MWGRRKQKKDVIVTDGVDIKSQMAASKQGMYFSGNDKQFQTYLIRGAAPSTWDLSFFDLDTGKTYRCLFADQMQIGRQAGRQGEIVLVLGHDKRVSKAHCRIYEAKGRLWLQDLHSKNHTYLNEKRCDAPLRLDSGSVIKAGNTRLKVEVAAKKGGRR